MISLKLKMPANTFQAVTKLFEPDLEYQTEAEDAPAVEATLQLSEETVIAILQTYKDMFPMLVLTSPHIFQEDQQESEGITRVAITPDQLMQHMQEQSVGSKSKKDPSESIKQEPRKGYL